MEKETIIKIMEALSYNVEAQDGQNLIVIDNTNFTLIANQILSLIPKEPSPPPTSKEVKSAEEIKEDESLKMKNVPQKIFLVVNCEEHEERDFSALDHEFVCWCQDRINKSDIEYTLNASQFRTPEPIKEGDIANTIRDIAHKLEHKGLHISGKLIHETLLDAAAALSSPSLRVQQAGECNIYEQDNTTAMNCKHCGRSKYYHNPLNT